MEIQGTSGNAELGLDLFGLLEQLFRKLVAPVERIMRFGDGNACRGTEFFPSFPSEDFRHDRGLFKHRILFCLLLECLEIGSGKVHSDASITKHR